MKFRKIRRAAVQVRFLDPGTLGWRPIVITSAAQLRELYGWDVYQLPQPRAVTIFKPRTLGPSTLLSDEQMRAVWESVTAK